jgi:hypothetical protein
MPRTLLIFILLLVVTCRSGRAQSSQSFPAALRRASYYVVLNPAACNLHRVVGRKVTASALGTTRAALEILNVLVPGELVRQSAAESANQNQLFGRADTLLIALSVLAGDTTHITWTPVVLDTLPAGRRLSLPDLIRDGATRLRAYRQRPHPAQNPVTRRSDLVPVLYRAGRYVVPAPGAFVLTEYLVVRSGPTKYPLAGDNVTLNVQSPAFPEDSIRQAVFHPQPRRGNADATLLFDLAGRYLLDGRAGNSYRFWYCYPGIDHPSMLDYGSGNLLYQPGVGLLSGQYRPFFSSSFAHACTDLFDVVRVESPPHY